MNDDFIAPKVEGTQQSEQTKKKFVSITEAARVNGVTRQAIYVAIKQKKLKAYKDATRWTIDLEDLDNYRRSMLRLGFGEDDLEREGSDRLVDAIVSWGKREAIRSRVQAHLEAGADHVCVQAIGPEPLEALRRLALAVCDL